MRFIHITCLLSICIFYGCSASNKSSSLGRYKQKHDGAPSNVSINLAAIKDAEPKIEPKSKYGNPTTYTVNNKTYRVLQSNHNYKERGLASWYGTKFHGFRTSSGEIYDMYSMTAAHKTLPLPTYAKITNLNNGKQAIVKINDRGPFHDNRVLDLSYAAAMKLGMQQHGVAKIELEVINTDKSKRSVKAAPVAPAIASNTATNSHYIQLGVFKKRDNAEKLVNRLATIIKHAPIKITPTTLNNKPIYKVHLGPINDELSLKKVHGMLASANIKGIDQKYAM